METVRIATTDHPLFAPLWAIYRESFPRNERRSFDRQQAAFRSDRYRLNAYLENGKIVGLAGYWDFPDYVYVEHLAVDSGLRGGGYGGRMLEDLLRSVAKTVVLEIEPVEDEATARRLRFYERAGFRVNSHAHRQYKYHDDDPDDFALTVLSYPDEISAEQYERFDRDLRETVMAGHPLP